MVCAICRRDRDPKHMQDGRAVCANTSQCNRIAANALLREPTRAQSIAKALSTGKLSY
jgi:hypothetical protein